ARLSEALINNGELEKAEKVLDLAMEKMPVKYFEYYSLLEPYIIGYYELNRPEKARKVYEEVSRIYQEHLLYYSGFKFERQRRIADDIITDMERYRSLVRYVAMYDDEEFARAEAKKFNDYLKLFRHFYSPDEALDIDKELISNPDIDMPIDSSLLEQMNLERSQKIDMEAPLHP
ncbi:MAG TPA: hypothetical protein VLZ54_09195, partial [Arenibacter sp.]|nr:hypothetical protein [Arenibacter sp.]